MAERAPLNRRARKEPAMNELRGLDNWITGVSDTTNPRSPYYTGPEFDLMICPCGCEFRVDGGPVESVS
jgi:hypothetical protein